MYICVGYFFVIADKIIYLKMIADKMMYLKMLYLLLQHVVCKVTSN